MSEDCETAARLESERLAIELRLTQDYWLEIQGYIAGRKLRGAEWYLARHTHSILLRGADRKADEWNRTDGGAKYPIPPNSRVNWNDLRFSPPEALYGDDLKPEVLAAIAAPLAANASVPWRSCFPQFVTKSAGLSPAEAISFAHGLLVAAERYIASLPKRPPTGAAEAGETARMAFTKVTFDEIMASNRRDSGSLRLLPPLQEKRKNKNADEISGSQTLEAIRKEVKKFLERKMPKVTEAEYYRDLEQEGRLEKEVKPTRAGARRRLTYPEWQSEQQAGIDDCMNNSRISMLNLCQLRWERFSKDSTNKSAAAVERERKKRKESKQD